MYFEAYIIIVVTSKCKKKFTYSFSKQEQYSNTFSQTSGESKWRKWRKQDNKAPTSKSTLGSGFQAKRIIMLLDSIKTNIIVHKKSIKPNW